MCYFFHSPVTLIGVRSHETSFVLDSIVFLVSLLFHVFVRSAAPAHNYWVTVGGRILLLRLRAVCGID